MPIPQMAFGDDNDDEDDEDVGHSGGGHVFKNNYGAAEDFEEGDLQQEDDEQFEEDSPMEKHLTKAILEEI